MYYLHGFWATSKHIQVLICFIQNLISQRKTAVHTTLANVDGLFLECLINGYISTHCALRQLITQKQMKQFHTSNHPMGHFCWACSKSTLVEVCHQYESPYALNKWKNHFFRTKKDIRMTRSSKNQGMVTQ